MYKCGINCCQLAIMSVVGNDACWSQIAREQVPMFGSAVACELEVRVRWCSTTQSCSTHRTSAWSNRSALKDELVQPRVPLSRIDRLTSGQIKWLHGGMGIFPKRAHVCQCHRFASGQ
jgi:hypothetical protein